MHNVIEIPDYGYMYHCLSFVSIETIPFTLAVFLSLLLTNCSEPTYVLIVSVET